MLRTTIINYEMNRVISEINRYKAKAGEIRDAGYILEAVYRNNTSKEGKEFHDQWCKILDDKLKEAHAHLEALMNIYRDLFYVEWFGG